MKLTLLQIQEESKNILIYIDSICRQLNLKYVLFWGSLIGAIRHQGFIPWDDDLDIAMPRKDYEKLKCYFMENKEKCKPFELFSIETRDEYPYMLPRICNTNFHLIAENEKDYGMGTFVDIYPMDGAGNGKHKFLYRKACLSTTLYGMKSRLHFQKTFSWKKNILKRIIYFASKMISVNFLQRKLHEYSKKYDYDDSEYVSCLTWCDGGVPLVCRKDDLFTVETVKFEDISVNIPKSYDSLLKQYYGDYMKLPPENQRIGHHYYYIETREN